LIRVREREEEAFITYRYALNKAIGEFRASGDTFSERDARALYSDIIAPKLTALNQKVNQAKRDLKTKASRSFIALAGVITFGVYTGIIPPEYKALATALGFTKTVQDILGNILPLGDAKNSIRNEELYFLWKVKNLRKYSRVPF
jgi:hypothetical protein